MPTSRSSFKTSMCLIRRSRQRARASATLASGESVTRVLVIQSRTNSITDLLWCYRCGGALQASFAQSNGPCERVVPHFIPVRWHSSRARSLVTVVLGRGWGPMRSFRPFRVCSWQGLRRKENVSQAGGDGTEPSTVNDGRGGQATKDYNPFPSAHNPLMPRISASKSSTHPQLPHETLTTPLSSPNPARPALGVL